MKVICPECGDGREYKPCLAVTLTGYCKVCARKGERGSQWRGGNVVLACVRCGRKKELSKSRAARHVRRSGQYFCRDCGLVERPCGVQSATWRGGRKRCYYPPEWSRVRRKIRRRDKGKCGICTGQRKRMPVHHIDYDKNNIDERNLILLCNPCHGKTNFNRQMWAKFFAKLMEAKYASA